MTDEGFPQDEFQESPSEKVFRGTGIQWWFVGLLLIGLLVIIVAVQNTENVGIEFLGWAFEAPLVLVLLVTFIAAVVIDEIVGLVFRRRRRRRLAEKEELKRLRGES